MLALGDGMAGYEAVVDEAREAEWANRLFARDTSLWTTDPDVAETIAERLGWLDAPAHFTDQIPSLEGFGDAIGRHRVHDRDRRRHGRQQPGAGRPPTDVRDAGRLPRAAHPRLDRSGRGRGRDGRSRPAQDPAASSPASPARPPSRTRSSPTHWARAEEALDEIHHHAYQNPGATVVAITDPGKSLEAIPHHDEFREVFLNPPDIGGRYSALTYVGLVPAALIGLDLDALLASASAMLGACREPEPTANPGDRARDRDRDAGQGRPRQADVPARRRDLGVRGVGRAAHRGEHRQARRRHRAGRSASRSARREAYGADRVFVRIALDGGDATAAATTALRRCRRSGAGHPVIRISIADPIDLGAEFVRWEVATAIAGPCWASTRSTSPTSRRPRS